MHLYFKTCVAPCCNMMIYNLVLYIQQGTIESGGVSDFRPKDKQVDSIPLQQPPFVDWRAHWICATRDKTARGVALCWTYKSWAHQCQLSKRIAQLSKVSPSLSLCLLSDPLYIFFSASELLSARTRAIQFLFISPPPPTPNTSSQSPSSSFSSLLFSHLSASPRSLLKPILPLSSP